ncbi:hypothetical protein CLF_110676 [Clonorchis sinensis]|uniref:Protein CNPPD1 n=1 Tax=Clonorchis sinensis TaxID=79923 RepID=G7YL10_CLOSI|nr:hypothetical protein CLF_110676 [Clonorchis sinensis]
MSFVVSAYAPTDCSTDNIEDKFYGAFNALLRRVKNSDIVLVAGEGIASFVNSVSRRRLGKLDRHSVVDYLRAKAVPSVSMLTALIFIEKIANTDPPPQLLDEITAVDLFAIAMTTASKYLYDIDTVDGSDNASWADVFNMDVQELNQLEIRFLSAINWSLFVAKSEYDQFRSFVHSLSSATSGRPLRSHSTKRSTRDTVARIQLKNKRLRTTAKATQNPEVKRKYQNQLLERLPDGTMLDINGHWEKIYKALLKAGTSVCGTAQPTSSKHWISDRTVSLLETRRQISLGHNHSSARRIIRRQVILSIRADREAWFTRKAEEMEDARNAGNVRKLFRMIRSTGPRKPLFSKTIRDRNGSLMCSKTERLDRWAQYFEQQFSWPPMIPTTKNAVMLHRRSRDVISRVALLTVYNRMACMMRAPHLAIEKPPNLDLKQVHRNHLLKSLSDKISRSENLVDREFADDIALIFKKCRKRKHYLESSPIQFFGICFASTKCKVMLLDVFELASDNPKNDTGVCSTLLEESQIISSFRRLLDSSRLLATTSLGQTSFSAVLAGSDFRPGWIAFLASIGDMDCYEIQLLAVLTAACLTSMAKDPGFFFQFESTPGANTRSMYPLGSLTLHTNPTTSPLRCTVNSSVDVIDGSCRLALLTGYWYFCSRGDTSLYANRILCKLKTICKVTFVKTVLSDPPYNFYWTVLQAPEFIDAIRYRQYFSDIGGKK